MLFAHHLKLPSLSPLPIDFDTYWIHGGPHTRPFNKAGIELELWCAKWDLPGKITEQDLVMYIIHHSNGNWETCWSWEAVKARRSFCEEWYQE